MTGTISGLSPSTIAAGGMSQTVSVSGSWMPNVSSDGGAFVVSASVSSCSGSVVSGVAGVTVVSNSWTSGSGISVVVSASATSAGMYVVCARWSAMSEYFTAGLLGIVSVTSVSPAVIPAAVGGSGGSSVMMTVSGVSLVNVSGDASGFVISSSGGGGGGTCASPVSAVTSVNSVFVNSSMVVLNVTDSGSVAGMYLLCMRVSPSTVYFWTGMNVTIGELTVLCCAVLCVSEKERQIERERERELLWLFFSAD